MKPWSVLLVALLAALAVPGCKAKTEIKDDPETLKNLTDCEKAREDQKVYISTLEKQLADLQLKAGGGDTGVTVTIQGEVMKIAGKGPRERAGEPRGSADDAKLYESFLAALKRSRGSIQKCYQSALKNNTSLQARTVTLNIQVDYRTSGAVSGASFSPRVSENFDQCMDAVAKRWSLPAMPRAVTFAYKQTLTPE